MLYTPIYIDYKDIFGPQPTYNLPTTQEDLDLNGRSLITEDNYILEIHPPRTVNFDNDEDYLRSPFIVRVNRLENFYLKLRLQLAPCSPKAPKGLNSCYKVNYYKWNKMLVPTATKALFPNNKPKKEFVKTEYWYVWDSRYFIQKQLDIFGYSEDYYWIRYIDLARTDRELKKTITVPYATSIDLTQYPEVIQIENIKHVGGDITGYQLIDTSQQHIPTFLDTQPLYQFQLRLDFSSATNVPTVGTDIEITYINPLDLHQILVIE